MPVEKEGGHFPDFSRKFRQGKTTFLFYDGCQGFHGLPVDAGFQGDTVVMGGGLIGRTAYPERSVSLFVRIVVRIALVIVDRLAGFGVGRESVPVLRTVRQFFDHKKQTDDSHEDTSQSKKILSSSVKAEEPHGRVFSGIQIFPQPNHADYGEEHEKGLSANGETVDGEQKKADMVFQGIPEGIDGGGERKEKQRSASRYGCHGGELQFRDVEKQKAITENTKQDSGEKSHRQAFLQLQKRIQHNDHRQKMGKTKKQSVPGELRKQLIQAGDQKPCGIGNIERTGTGSSGHLSGQDHFQEWIIVRLIDKRREAAKIKKQQRDDACGKNSDKQGSVSFHTFFFPFQSTVNIGAARSQSRHIPYPAQGSIKTA